MSPIDTDQLTRTDGLIDEALYQVGKDRYSDVVATEQLVTVVRGLAYAVLALVALQRGQYPRADSEKQS